jgi:hypothetical protein
LELIVNLWYNTYMVATANHTKRTEIPRPLEVGGDGNRDFRNNPKKVETLTGEELLVDVDRTKVAGDILKKVDQIEAGEAPAVDPNILNGAEMEAPNPNAHLDNLQELLKALNNGEPFDPTDLTERVLGGKSELN